MKKLVVAIILLISFTAYGQSPDFVRTKKVNDQNVVDARPKAYLSLNIPHFPTWTLNGAKDSIAYVMYNTTLNKFGVYVGLGVWKEYATVEELNLKVDKVTGKSLLDDTEIAKLITVQTGATANSTDATLRDRTTHTGVQGIGTVTGLQADLDLKLNAIDSPIALEQAQVQRSILPFVAWWGDSLTQGSGSSGGFTAPNNLATKSGFTVFNGGVGGETSSQIKTRFDAGLSIYGTRNTILWVGHNNRLDPTTVKADIAAMIAALGHPRFLVLSVTNQNFSTEWSGTANYNTIMQLNADLKSTYPNNYLDVRSYLVTKGTGSAQDLIDLSHDAIPSSLTTDGIHLNNAGYLLVSNYIYNNFSKLFGNSDGGYFTDKNIAPLFTRPPSIGEITPNTAVFTNVNITDGTRGFVIKPYTFAAGFGGIWTSKVVSGGANYTLISDGDVSTFNGVTTSTLAAGGTNRIIVTTSGISATLPISGTSITGTSITGTDGTRGLSIRPYLSAAGFGAIYSTTVTPGAVNHSLISNGAVTILNGTTNAAIAINGSGKVDFGTTVATFTTPVTINERLTLATGTTTKAPLNIPAGVLNTTPVSGNIENDGVNFSYTDNTATRRTMVNLVGAQTLQNKTFGAGNTWQGNIIAPAFLGTGTANATTFLAGDGTYKGVVSSVTSANTDIAVATGTTTPVLTLNTGLGAFKIVKTDGNGDISNTGLDFYGRAFFSKNGFQTRTTPGSSFPYTTSTLDRYEVQGLTGYSTLQGHRLVFGGASGHAGFFQELLPATTLTANSIITLPNIASGTVALTSDVAAVAAVTGYTISTKTANYTETATSGTVIIKGDTNTTGFTITLPSAVGNKSTIIIKKTAALNTLTVNTTLSQTIDTSLTAVLTRQHESITLVSDNSNWIII